jgi:hypothetical protein
MAETINSIFTNTLSPRDVTAYTLGRGVTDMSNLAQFNNFETGYPFLITLKIPIFLEQLAASNDEYKKLIDIYRHILEYDFRGIDGIEDISSDTSEITNGISTLNVITKVNMQSASQFQMRYFERQGSVFTKVHELFLRGIKDPRTQVKTYNGLLRASTSGGVPVMDEAGYEYETFQFLYFVTDNTCRKIEKAYLIVSAQPTTAETSMYNAEKGDIGWKELNVQFNGYPITGPAITAKAVDFLKWINENTIFEDAKFGYQAISKMPTPGNTGITGASSPSLS